MMDLLLRQIFHRLGTVSTGTEKILLLKESILAGSLPPWDRRVRVGLIAKGFEKEVAVFDNFELKNL